MWCVAELNEEYIARMEDVLKIYEKPLSERAYPSGQPHPFVKPAGMMNSFDERSESGWIWSSPESV